MKSRPSLLSLALFASFCSGGMMSAPDAQAKAEKSIYDFEVKQISADGKALTPKKLSDYKGKVLLIVNTASECGYTKQYKGLQAIYAKYKAQGFEVLGFPSNDYGAQEPGSNAEIKNFCERQFKVTFPLFEKAPVSGNRIQPLYAYLTTNAPTKGAVGWNFEKFLVSKDGHVIGRYKSAVEPESAELAKAIDGALDAKCCSINLKP